MSIPGFAEMAEVWCWLCMPRISVDSKNNGKQPRRLFPVEEGRHGFLQRPHNTSLSFFLDFKGVICRASGGKTGIKCSEGRFVEVAELRLPPTLVSTAGKGWMCFIVMSYKGWVVNSLEQGCRVTRELDIAGVCNPGDTVKVTWLFLPFSWASSKPVSHIASSPSGLDSGVIFKVRLSLTIPTISLTRLYSFCLLQYSPA